MKKNYKIWRGLTGLLGLILCFAIFFSALAFTREGDVNVFLGVKPPEQDVTGDTSYYKSEYSSKEEMQEALKEHVENVEIEGSVLLKNDDNALPLNSGASVTLFGLRRRITYSTAEAADLQIREWTYTRL